MKHIGRKTYLLALLVLTLAACDGGGSSSTPPAGGGGPPPPPPPELTSLNPAANASSVLVGANVRAIFDQNMNVGDANTFVVNGSLTGNLTNTGAYAGGGTPTLSFNTLNNFKPGEGVEVTLTTGLTATSGASLDQPVVYRFRAAAAGGNADFVPAGTEPVGADPISVTAGDWDGDGDLDLGVANSFTFDVTVLLNDGLDASGLWLGFSEAPTSPVTVANQPSAITAGDWDGDGDLDLAVTLAVANQFTDDVTVLLNDGLDASGLWLGFSEAPTSPVTVGNQPSAITSGDWDGDGDLDLGVANSFTFDVTVLLNDGLDASGLWLGFSEAPTSPVTVGSQPSDITTGDWNGDGILDLAVTNSFTFDVTVLLNDGSAGFSEPSGSPIDVGNQPSAITVGDWDGDRDLDLAVALAVANQFTNDVRLFLNDGLDASGLWLGFSEAPTSPVTVGSQPSDITTGDWDGDGILDLAVTNSFTFDVTVLLNDGSAGFSEPSGSPIDVGNQPSAFAEGDWDGDGDLDLAVALAVANQFIDNLRVLQNGP